MDSAASSRSARKSTVDRAEAALGESAPKKRRLSRRDTNAQVERTLAEQFKGYGPLQTDVLRNDAGRTLREQLTHDKHASKQEGTRTGSSYYADLRKQFPLAGACGPTALTPDKKQAVDPELQKALSLLLHPNTTKQSSGAFRSWMQTAPPCNRRELIGIIKAVATLRPSRNTLHQTAVALDVAKYIVKHSLHTEHKEEIATVKHIFDSAFVCQFASLKKNDASRSQFLEIVGDSIGLVLDLPLLRTVMAHEGEWSKVTQQIGQLVMGSSIGEKLFSFAWIHVAGEAMESSYTAACAECARPFTSATCQAIKKKVFKQAEAMHIGNILDQKRTIAVHYRGDPCEVQVHSLGEELSIRLAAECKSCSVGNSLLALSFESSLAAPFKDDGGCEGSVVKDYTPARLAVNDYLSHHSVTSGDLLSELVKAKAPLFLQLDPTFKVELSWVAQVTGQGGVEKMCEKLLALLPSSTSHSDVPQVMDELTSLMKSEGYKFAARSAQNQAEALLGIISGLKQGQPYNENQFVSSPWLQQVGLRLPFFVKHQVDETTVVAGPPALRAKLAFLSEKVQKGEVVTLDEVEPCQLYQQVFTNEERQTLGTVVEKVIGQASIGAFAQKRSATAAQGSGSSGGKREAKKDDFAASLFD